MRGRKNERIFSAREKKSEKLRAVIAGEKKLGWPKWRKRKRERETLYILPSLSQKVSFSGLKCC